MMRIKVDNWRSGKGIPAFIRIDFNQKESKVTCMAVKWGGYFKRLCNKKRKKHETDCPISNSEMFQGCLYALLQNDFDKKRRHVYIDDITKLFKPNTTELEDCFRYLEHLLKYNKTHITFFIPLKKVAEHD
jgi:hypothetical protein